MEEKRRGSLKRQDDGKSDSGSDTFTKQCRKFFRDLDTNGDGRLDRSEFAMMIQRIGLKLSNYDIQKAFNRTDKNQDGSISFREFVDYYSKELCPGSGLDSEKKIQAKASETNKEYMDKKEGESEKETDKVLIKCRKYFCALDTDGNGKLDWQEFSHMLCKIGVQMDVACMRKAFGHVDKDADGGITFREFAQYYNVLKAEK